MREESDDFWTRPERTIAWWNGFVSEIVDKGVSEIVDKGVSEIVVRELEIFQDEPCLDQEALRPY